MRRQESRKQAQMQLSGMRYATSFVRKNPFVSPFVCSSSSFKDPLNESRGNWDAGSLYESDRISGDHKRPNLAVSLLGYKTCDLYPAWVFCYPCWGRPFGTGWRA